MKSYYIYILCIILTSTSLFSQKLEFVQDELIVMFDEGIDQDFLVIQSRSTNFPLNVVEASPIKGAPMNIQVVKLDSKTNLYEAIKLFESKPWVVHAQTNKLLNYRAIPNDSLFTRQWQYINDGSNGGVEGADIDAEEAWDVTTGGVTANGDTIVVCVIDDGYDTDHEDMLDNLWINHDEIPGDLIDNDNNGYVDDINGWNLMNDINDIGVNGSHGTPVAGIIGAKGDNGVGVSGVNWDVKLMIMKQKNSLSESNVIESYAYAYNKRKLYNETNGAQGAFVVATNASWGIDNGDPKDSPIWCSFYDSLGVQGILNCGATANRNFNIDETGDLPTACSSDYMLSVTNMNRSDQKVNSAGYGRVNIDIGAHGSEGYTTALGNSYSGFGGTSGATPHVTGAVALLYAAPCNVLADLSMSNPGLAAFAVKEILLNNLDELDGLVGLTTSRGRLNLNKAIIGVQQLCESTGATYGFGVQSDVMSNEFTWDENKTGLQTDLRIRQFDETEWVEYIDINSGFNLPDLVLCDSYEYQTKSYIIGDSIGWGFSRFFDTKGCCEASSVVEVTMDDGTLYFDLENETDNIDNYLEYRLFGDTEWITIITKEDIEITDFEPCALIEYRLHTVCNQFNVVSDTSEVQTITTECGQCTANDYCEFDEFDNEGEWIESISIGSETFKSGRGTTSYNKFTGGFIPVLAVGEDYNLVLEPGFSGNSFSELFQIYVDLDQDGSFDENTERVFEATGSVSSTLEDTLNIPITALLGLTRMRVIMSFNQATEACDFSGLAFGEVEDYCIELTPSVGVDDQLVDQVKMKVEPTISDGIFDVKIDAKNSIAGTVIVMTVNGSLVYKQELRQSNSQHLSIDGQAWQSGLYILTYVTEASNYSYSQKLIKL